MHQANLLVHLVIYTLLVISNYSLSRGETTAVYDASEQSLLISKEGIKRFKFRFNKGGAINAIYDLQIAPEENLVGESFQGETTDRVIQWTYWNSRYLGLPHASGDHDTRANVTMEGCFHGTFTCEALESPKSGLVQSIRFRSRIEHWFYSELDRHGTPDFETTTIYEVLEDGSLRMTREVLRRPWHLQNVTVKSWDGKKWVEENAKNVKLDADHLWNRSMTSYFEAWTPLRRTILTNHQHANGKFEGDGYQFWKPQDLGGWAIAYGDNLGVAIVFGKKESMKNRFETRVVFNKQDLPQHRLTNLLPGVETDWPDNAILSQTLVVVVGAPEDVKARANSIVETIPLPEIREEQEVEAADDRK